VCCCCVGSGCGGVRGDVPGGVLGEHGVGLKLGGIGKTGASVGGEKGVVESHVDRTGLGRTSYKKAGSKKGKGEGREGERFRKGSSYFRARTQGSKINI